MKIYPSVKTKLLTTAEPGELVLLRRLSQRLVAIVIEVAAPQVSLAIIGGAETPPFHQVIRGPQSPNCVSFGKDWLIEIIPTAETWPGNSKFHYTPGAIMLHDRECWLFLDAESNYSNELAVSLTTLAVASAPPTNAAPFLKWRIWLSDDDRLKSNQIPFIEFKYTAS